MPLHVYWIDGHWICWNYLCFSTAYRRCVLPVHFRTWQLWFWASLLKRDTNGHSHQCRCNCIVLSIVFQDISHCKCDKDHLQWFHFIYTVWMHKYTTNILINEEDTDNDDWFHVKILLFCSWLNIVLMTYCFSVSATYTRMFHVQCTFRNAQDAMFIRWQDEKRFCQRARCLGVNEVN